MTRAGRVSSAVGLLVIATLSAPARAEYAEGMEHYRKAWAAYRTHRYDDAKRWAGRAVQADPENGHAQALLGEIAYLRHDLAGAKAAWEKALALNPQLAGPLKEQIAQVEAETALEGEMKEAMSYEPRARSAHSSKLTAQSSQLVIRMPKDLPEEEARTIVDTLAQAMAGLEPYFQYRVSRPLTVLIYPREFFYGNLHLPTEVLGLFDGKIRIPIVDRGSRISDLKSTIPNPKSEISSTLWHEYAHAVVHDLTNGWAPRWLHEGLAEEAGRIADQRIVDRGLRISDLKSTIHNPKSEIKLPPLRALLGISERPGEPVVMPAGQFYAASCNLVQYLLERNGWDRMRRLLVVLGQGMPIEEALRKEYGLDLFALEKKWRE